MELINITKQHVNLDLPRDEIRLLCNSLNEVCNGMRLNDFESKIGISREDADAFHNDMRKNYIKMMEGVDEYLEEIEPIKFNITFFLKRKHLSVLRNALAEICVGFCENEFLARQGIDLKEALITLEALHSILKKME